MAVTIKNIQGQDRFSINLNEGAKRIYTLMGDDYVMLPFSVPAPIDFSLGDYTDIEGFGRFVYNEIQAPTYNTTTGGYDYELRLENQHLRFKNKLLKYSPNVGGKETTWSLTATIAVHAEQLMNNIKALCDESSAYKYNGNTDWVVAFKGITDAEKNVAKVVDYDATNIIDGLTAIAEAFECEWWVTDNIINFGRCDYGDDYINLEMGENVAEMSQSSNGDKYATRLYVFGSDKNIAENYRKDLVFSPAVVRLDDFYKRIELQDVVHSPILASYFPSELHEKREAVSNPIVLKADMVGGKEIISNSGRGTYPALTAKSEYVEVSNLYYNHASPTATLKVDTSTIQASVRRSIENESGWISGNGEPMNTMKIANLFQLYIHAKPNKNNDTGIKSAFIEWGVRYNANTNTYESIVPNTEVSINTNINSGGKAYLSAEFRLVQQYEAEFGDDDAQYQLNQNGTIDWKGAITLVDAPIRVNDIKVEFLTGALKDRGIILGALNYGMVYDGNGYITLPYTYNGIVIYDEKDGTIVPKVDDKFIVHNIYESRVPTSWFVSRYANEGEDTMLNGIVTSRLMLPEGTDYIDVYRYDANGERVYAGEEGYDKATPMPIAEAIEDIVVFDDVYPRIESKVETLEGVQVKESEESEKTFTQFKFTAYTFNKANPFGEQYLLAGQTLQMTFSSGILNGWTFDVEWVKGSNSFNIVRNTEQNVPNEILKPSVGDEFVFTNFNAGILNEEATTDAEQELLDKGYQYAKESIIDPSTYTCTMRSDVVAGFTPSQGIQEDKAMVLSMGSKVRLINRAFFANGRESRVIGIEQNLDIPYDSPVYTIGEKPAYSRLGAIEDRIDAVALSKGASASSQTSVSGGSSVYIIGREDKTPATDTNVYSALRARKEFMSRNQAEQVNHLWQFNEGIDVGKSSIDKNGNATFDGLKVNKQANLKDVVVDGNIGSRGFDSSVGAIGAGFGIVNDNGLHTLTIDNIAVRNKMVVAELVIQEYKSVGGVLVLSVANGEIDKVTPVMEVGGGLTYQCHIKDFDKHPFFVVNDFVRCSRWERKTNKYVNYWVKVQSVNNGNIIINANELDGVVPQVGDSLVQFGNATDKSRQGLIIISVEDGAPNITAYDGIDSKTLYNRMKARLGKLEGIVDGNGRSLKDYGLWTENLYLGSSSVADPFAQLTSRFDVISGKLQSVQESVYGNLLAETNQGKKNWSFGSNGVVDVDIYDAEEVGLGTGVFFERMSGENAPWETFIYPVRPECIVSGRTYTLSFEIFVANATASSQMRVYVNDGNAMYSDVATCDKVTTEGQWVKATATFTATKNGTDTTKNNLNVNISMVNIGSWVSLAIRNMMLNEGNVAMAYTPSDYDHIYSSIEQSAEAISLKVDDLNDDLKATGIDVKKGEITLTADKVAVKNNEGKTTAMFDERGKLSTEVIDADKIITRQVLGINRENGQVVTSINIDGNGLYYTHYPVAYENGIANPNSLMAGIEQPHEGHYIGIVASKMGYDKPTDSVMSVFDTYGNPMWRMVIGDRQRYGIVTSFDKWELTGLSEMNANWLTADKSALAEDFKKSVFPTSVDFVKNGDKWEAKPTWGMSFVPLPPIAYKEFKAGENSAYSEFDKFVKKSIDYQVADYDFTSGVTGLYATGTRGVQGVVNVAETEQMTTLSVVYTFYWYEYDNGRLVDSKSQGSVIFMENIVK